MHIAHHSVWLFSAVLITENPTHFAESGARTPSTLALWMYAKDEKLHSCQAIKFLGQTNHKFLGESFWVGKLSQKDVSVSPEPWASKGAGWFLWIISNAVDLSLKVTYLSDSTYLGAITGFQGAGVWWKRFWFGASPHEHHLLRFFCTILQSWAAGGECEDVGGRGRRLTLLYFFDIF